MWQINDADDDDDDDDDRREVNNWRWSETVVANSGACRQNAIKLHKITFLLSHDI